MLNTKAHFLNDIKSRMGNHTLVVSMPNISPISIPTIKETIAMAKTGHRPETGVLDRTHQILTNLEGYKKLFEEAGYGVIKSEISSYDEGMSGEWKWKNNNSYGEDLNQHKVNAYKLLGRNIGPSVISSLTGRPRQDVENEINAFHGFYVLKPSK